jgi:DNA-binding beta-propeller fold protein YncE
MLALVVVVAGSAASALACASALAAPNTPDPATGFLLNGRQLTPQGAQVALGNFPTGGAVTADGRFLWTVSAGLGANDIRIVDIARRRVTQVIPIPGASGGIALDSRHRRAYVSGVTVSRWWPTQDILPGVMGNVVLVYGWDAASGQARFLRTISVAAVPNAPLVQQYPLAVPGAPFSTNAWPQKLAVSPDGSRLLVPLNLADSAAVVDIDEHDRVRYVAVKSGSYPFGAAILPGGRKGLVSNEATGTVSVVDLRRGVKVRDISVGPPLSHPEGIAVDAAGSRAYVAVSALDEVAVVSLRS